MRAANKSNMDVHCVVQSTLHAMHHHHSRSQAHRSTPWHTPRPRVAFAAQDERLLAVVYVKSIKRGPQQGHKSLLCLTINNKTDAVTLQKLKVEKVRANFLQPRVTITAHRGLGPS